MKRYVLLVMLLRTLFDIIFKKKKEKNSKRAETSKKRSQLMEISDRLEKKKPEASSFGYKIQILVRIFSCPRVPKNAHRNCLKPPPDGADWLTLKKYTTACVPL